MPPKRTSNLEKEGNIKRNRVSVSLEKKLEVLRRIESGEKIVHLESGEKIVQICNALGLAKSTIQTIRDNADKIKEHSQLAAPNTTSRLTRQRSNILEKMEKLLLIWIEDNNNRRMPMSQMIIQEKALSIFETLKSSGTNETDGDITFLASRGWFDKFKGRHNLHSIKMKGEAASADENAASEYPKTLKNIIEAGGYVPEQIFNVDETSLYWKRMPDRTYISRDKRSASGYKVSKERLTLLLGANAAGDFRLKPLLIYISENPRPFKGIDKNQLPVIWKSNKNAWMTKIIFTEWFKKHFCPAVEKYLKMKNLSNKVLLLLDNAPGHPINLTEITENVQVEYLPKNTTALIQPMDQGVIAIFKAYYLRRTFKGLINQDNGGSLKELWKKYNIKDAVDNIGKSWEEVNSTALNRVWKAIWPECVMTDEVAETDSLSTVQQNIVNLANELGFEDVTDCDVVNLLNADKEPLSNEDLINFDQQQLPDDEAPKPTEPQKLSLHDLSKALDHFEQGMSILATADPNEERIAKVMRGINAAITCYKEIQTEARNKAKQQTIDLFFKPKQSSPSAVLLETSSNDSDSE